MVDAAHNMLDVFDANSLLPLALAPVHLRGQPILMILLNKLDEALLYARPNCGDIRIFSYDVPKGFTSLGQGFGIAKILVFAHTLMNDILAFVSQRQ